MSDIETAVEFKTDEQRAAHLAALEREAAGYKARSLPDRVKAVEAEIKRVGGAKTPRKADTDPAGE